MGIIKRKRQRIDLGLMALEPRWMFDGAAAVDAAHAASDSHPVDTHGADTPVVVTPPRVLVVASNIADGEDLAKAAKDGVIVVRYDADTDTGAAILAKIAQALDGQQADSIAFASHNAGDGALDISAALPMDLASLAANGQSRAFWQGVGGLLTQTGRIDLLECSVAGSPQGDMMVSLISDVAGHQVAASTDATGNAASGGDWVLERGNVDAAATYFDAGRLNTFSGVLQGIELWVTDGTGNHTYLVADINANGNGSPIPIEGRSDVDSSVSRSYTVFNNKIYFQANDGSHGMELWSSDGTEAGTTLVKDIKVGSGSSSIQYAVVADGKLYFQADDGGGARLWVSDGTTAGTTKVAAAAGLTNPFSMTWFNNKLFFIGNDTAAGTELCVYDPTADTAGVVKDIMPGTWHGTFALSALSTKLLLAANSGGTGQELWTSDGTNAGTTMLLDAWPGTGDGLSAAASEAFNYFTVINDKAYFVAKDGNAHDYEPWVTDGTLAGTGMLADLTPGLNQGTSVQSFVGVGTDVFFSGSNINGSRIYKTDGVIGGTTVAVTPTLDIGGYLTALNGSVYFSANDGTHGRELMTTDGTLAGAGLVKDIYAGSNGSQSYFIYTYNNKLYFSAYTSANGTELWSSDGSAAGTALYKDIATGANGSLPKYFTVFNGKLYFNSQTTSSSDDIRIPLPGPTFGGSSSASIRENYVGVVYYTSATSNVSAITYSLTGADAGKFNIDATTGRISFKTSPDYEVPGSAAGTNTYSIIINATDTDATRTKAVTISVRDQSPSWNAAVYSVADSVVDGASVGTPASNGDTSSVSWSILGGNADGLFAINATTGAITIADATKFNFAATPSYTLSLRLSDGTNTSDQNITVNLTHAVGGGAGAGGVGGTGGSGGSGSTNNNNNAPRNHGGSDTGGGTGAPTTTTTTATATTTTTTTVSAGLGTAPAFGTGGTSIATMAESRTGTTGESRAGGIPIPASAPPVIPVVMTAQFTPPTVDGGFRVPVVTATQGGPAVEGLVALRPEIQMPPLMDGVVRLAIPMDAFVHTRSDAVVTLNAQRINGQPLPSWLAFDSRSGTLTGQPPVDFKGTMVVRIIAHDDKGQEATITIRINGQPEKTGAVRDGKPQKLADSRLGKLAFTQQLKLAARFAAIRFS